MPINTLEIADFRNLQALKLQCSEGLNLITGGNAAGKTSVLEAIYFLGRARSFRTSQPRDLIRDGANMFRIVATLSSMRTGKRRIPVGIERSARDFSARIDGTPVRSLAELAMQVPVLLFNPDSHRLFEDSPQQRRRFIDWGVFHWDAAFLPAWKRYRSALRQRNTALRNGAPDRVVDAWDDELHACAEILDRLRAGFCEALQEALHPFITLTLGVTLESVDYRRGWSQDRVLADILRAGRSQDRQAGYTRSGPHRADFMLRLQNHSAPGQLSRGQQKLLVIALILAQSRLYRERRQETCIILLDDLPAELDERHRGRVMDCLAGLQSQLFVSAIDPELLKTDAWHNQQRFEITHGLLAEWYN